MRQHNKHKETTYDLADDWRDYSSDLSELPSKGLSRKQERKFSSRKMRNKNKPRHSFD